MFFESIQPTTQIDYGEAISPNIPNNNVQSLQRGTPVCGQSLTDLPWARLDCSYGLA